MECFDNAVRRQVYSIPSVLVERLAITTESGNFTADISAIHALHADRQPNVPKDICRGAIWRGWRKVM